MLSFGSTYTRIIYSWHLKQQFWLWLLLSFPSITLRTLFPPNSHRTLPSPVMSPSPHVSCLTLKAGSESCPVQLSKLKEVCVCVLSCNKTPKSISGSPSAAIPKLEFRDPIPGELFPNQPLVYKVFLICHRQHVFPWTLVIVVFSWSLSLIVTFKTICLGYSQNGRAKWALEEVTHWSVLSVEEL